MDAGAARGPDPQAATPWLPRRVTTRERLVTGRGPPEHGAAFESWIFQELVAHRDYQGGDEIRHWRSDSGREVDFALGDHTAIEVKATGNVTDRDLRSLQALAEEKKLERYLCVCTERRLRTLAVIQVVPRGLRRCALSSGVRRASLIDIAELPYGPVISTRALARVLPSAPAE